MNGEQVMHAHMYW